MLLTQNGIHITLPTPGQTFTVNQVVSFGTTAVAGIATANTLPGDLTQTQTFGVVTLTAAPTLTPNSLYYADGSNDLTLTVTSKFVGISISTNTIFVSSAAP
jgi:hypothetical protein